MLVPAPHLSLRFALSSERLIPLSDPTRSGCRAVRYCGTACSHADWHAGHKHVCKALGEARASAKAARRQPAAAGAEEDVV